MTEEEYLWGRDKSSMEVSSTIEIYAKIKLSKEEYDPNKPILDQMSKEELLHRITRSNDANYHITISG